MRHLGVAVGAIKLAERVAVIVEAQPGHAVKDRLGRLGRRAGAVGVFDPSRNLPPRPRA